MVQCPGDGEPESSGGPAEGAGTLVAAALLRFEKGADEAGAATHSGQVRVLDLLDCS